MTKLIDTKEVAKLVRKSLKEAFPGVKFSVRTDRYSGGSSIRIGWTDGPTEKQVNAVAQRFAGGYFDGMIDYKGSITSFLDGECVRFMADFIFADREYSDEATQNAIDIVYKKYENNFKTNGVEKPTVEQHKKGKLWDTFIIDGGSIYDSLQCLINEERGKRSRIVTKDSPTARRTFPLYDDGYSQYMGTGTAING